MRTRYVKWVVLALVAMAAALASTTIAFAHGNGGASLRDVRDATKQFKHVEVAEAAKYGRFLDAQGIACIDMPGMGAMGIHYVNGDVVGDDKVEPLHPEALVYEPLPHGGLRLVALEYIVFKDAWDASHHHPPSLFGQEFMFTPDGNRFGIPAFYSLHAWIFKANPAGTFAMWNPDVTCAFA